MTPTQHTIPAPDDRDWGEQLVFCAAPEAGLQAIIAIDSTTLGPAIGGTRIRPYPTVAEAVQDARRLARAMTTKAALAGLAVGGGKAVIIADPATDKTEALLRAYGRFVDTLGGRYVAAQDVGTAPEDLDLVGRETPWVVGRSVRVGGSGDPSGFTALGVFRAMEAVAEHRHDSALTGLRIVVLGVGSVGGALVELLVEAGAEVMIADVSAARLDELHSRFGVAIVPWETAHRADCDIFAPCGLGGGINAETIPELRCWAVVGAANNQLRDPEDAELLAERNIDYVPDFLSNAGGLIAGSSELLLPRFERAHALAAIDQIRNRTALVLRRAAETGVTALAAAELIAAERVESARRLPLLHR
jgi:glutamate dehydrogenase/leucine dehydrogenase